MNDIEELLNKYFEGQTSLNEERFLRKYFQQPDIPESMEVYRSMFNFFTEEKTEDKPLPKSSSRVIRMRWVGVGAAASILLFFGIKSVFNSGKGDKIIHSDSMVYIDGKKYTDMKTIQLETLNTLEIFSGTGDDVISSQIDMLESFNE